MAPSFGVAEQRLVRAAATPEVELRRRNEELEREVLLGKEREEGLRYEVEKVRARLREAEEAEERLCVQLGELEAEAAEQHREYQQRIRELTQELALAKSIIGSSSSSLSTEG